MSRSEHVTGHAASCSVRVVSSRELLVGGCHHGSCLALRLARRGHVLHSLAIGQCSQQAFTGGQRGLNETQEGSTMLAF